MERVQALAGISRSCLFCHSNETRAPIANPPNSAQLGGTLPFLQVIPGSVQQCGNAARDRRTDTQTCVASIHFTSSTTHAKCNIINNRRPSRVQKVTLRHLANLRGDRSNRCRDMAIFQFFFVQNGGRPPSFIR